MIDLTLRLEDGVTGTEINEGDTIVCNSTVKVIHDVQGCNNYSYTENVIFWPESGDSQELTAENGIYTVPSASGNLDVRTQATCQHEGMPHGIDSENIGINENITVDCASEEE